MIDKITPAKTVKTICQLIMPNSHSATGAPNIWPTLPAAVTTASDIERFSSEAARPTTAKITPNPGTRDAETHQPSIGLVRDGCVRTCR